MDALDKFRIDMASKFEMQLAFKGEELCKEIELELDDFNLMIEKTKLYCSKYLDKKRDNQKLTKKCKSFICHYSLFHKMK